MPTEQAISSTEVGTTQPSSGSLLQKTATSADSLLGGLAAFGGFNLPGFTGGAAGPAVSGAPNEFNDRNLIDIAPVGVNIGEILKNYDIPPENGGLGLTRASRFFGDTASAVAGNLGSTVPVLLVVAAAGTALFFLIRKVIR
ncbi:hypothetical protein LCGC14_0838030 [marine sediment metagenome]|uniref:Uncharacterized protein n=1 Tax=marine sediment metagenome TaxID=412755 RepID=A0A0F9PDZ0_9ZZZZ